MNSWMIADTHFCHKNIIEFEERPFSSVEEMNKVMIKNWNSVVNKRDVVYHLGDVCFADKDTTTKIVQQLRGRKFLIMGNHDRARSAQWWRDVGFEKVYDKGIILHNFLLLTHEPLYLRQVGPFANFHGHIHSKELKGLENSLCHYNMGVENINYTPKLLNDMLPDLMKENNKFEVTMDTTEQDVTRGEELLKELMQLTFHMEDEDAIPIVDTFVGKNPEILESYSIEYLHTV